MNSQERFIIRPIYEILEEAVSACSGIGSGIETYPLYDYVMQSTFIKMTGAQEQKMKAICWEMAANDYEYRYQFTRSQLGECSSYKEKQKVYSDLVEQIEKMGLVFGPTLITGREGLSNDIIAKIADIFQSSNLAIWAEHDFLNFKGIIGRVPPNGFANLKNVIFSDTRLFEIYDKHLYKHRNRIAHNAQSYQQNLPTLNLLMQDGQRYENYFVYFFMLMLIDDIFIQLFKKYMGLWQLRAT